MAIRDSENVSMAGLARRVVDLTTGSAMHRLMRPENIKITR
jgi:hypothetical protein